MALIAGVTLSCGSTLRPDGNPVTVLTPPQTVVVVEPTVTAVQAVQPPSTVVVQGVRAPQTLQVAVGAPPNPDGGPRIVCSRPTSALAGMPVQLQAEAQGDGVRVRWEVRSAPGNNRAYRFAQRFDANDTDAVVAAGASVPFTSVIVGEYEVVATARDAEGRTAECSTTVAMTGHGLRVELSWDSNGTDVDLHALRGTEGGWFSSSDCYYANRTPDTGYPDEGRRRWLDTDDVDGYGPENIRVDTPEGNEDFNIGVHFYSAHSQSGPTRATVVVYCGERQMARFERNLVGNRGTEGNDFWRVAAVRFGGAHGCEVRPIQQVVQRNRL